MTPTAYRHFNARRGIDACLGMAFLFIAAAVADGGLRQAIAQSKATGKPLLIVAYSPGEGTSEQFKNMLQKDVRLRPVLAQFVGHLVAMNDINEAALFAKTFDAKGVRLPMMIISDPQGRVLERSHRWFGSGGEQDSKEFAMLLRTVLKGLAPPPADPLPVVLNDFGEPNPLARKEEEPTVAPDPLLDALREARKLLRQKKTGQAVKILAAHADADGNSGTRLAIKKMVEKLETEAALEVRMARAKLSTPGQELYGALALAKARRIYGPLPNLNRRFDQLWNELIEDSETRPLLIHAAAIDKARAFESEDRIGDAIGAYEEFGALYPDSPAAQLVKSRIAKLKQQSDGN